MREEAEFCIEDAGGMFLASTQGQRDEAWREIQHYAAQYADEGPLTIYEVTRKVVTDAGEAALRTAGATGPLGDPTALALPSRGLVVLKNVIQLLREEARFVDEEGDDTNALDELLEALCAHGVQEVPRG